MRPLPKHPGLHAAFVEKGLDFGDGMGPVVDHRRDQGGIGLSPGKDVEEVLRFPRAAGGDHRDADMTRYQRGQVEFLAV